MSAKASNQPGRRTPLSLTGGITKGQSNNAKTAGGNSTNGHTNNNKNQQQKKTEQQQQQSNAQKQQQQQAEAKENPAKMQNKNQGSETKIPKLQANQNSDSTNNKSDNKKVAAADKQQNGVVAAASNKANNTNQQQQPQGSNKDKKESSAAEAKTNEKDNNVEEKTTKEEKDDKKSSKEDKKEQHDLKKDENKTTDEKKENDSKKTEKAEMAKPEIPAKDEKKPKESQKQTVEKMDVVEVEEEQQQQKQDDDDPQTKKNSGEKSAAPSTPKSAKAENTKAPTPNKTPNKASVEKTPTKSTNEEAANKTTSVVNTSAKSTPTKREVTTAIDDVEMEPLTVADQSPSKAMPSENIAAGVALAFLSATSTPGKIVLSKRNVPAAKTDVQLAMQSSSSPDRPRAFSQISGRRGIRPITDYTPSKFQSNSQFRESYRRINTELDCTNTSLNVTVGSEVANNSSFSFFGRGRKRERTPPHHHSQSAIGELQTDVDMSPPKRARMDFFSVVSSPLTLLRNRFSKANLQSSTPVKLQKKLEDNDDEDIEVQNVSGVSVHEDIEKPDNAQENAEEVGGDTTLGVEATTADHHTPTEGELEIDDNGTKELPLKTEKLLSEDGDIKITVTDAVAKNKRCIVM